MSVILGALVGVHINDRGPFPAELHVEVEQIDVSQESAKLNPNWSAYDSNGHFHAYASDASIVDQFPTLRVTVESRDCNGMCGGTCGGEGYTVNVYRCRICAEVIAPGVIPGPHYGTKPGRKKWTVTFTTAETLPWRGDEVTVLYVAGETAAFGTGYLAPQRIEGSGGDIRVTYEVFGNSPLGRFDGTPETPARRPTAGLGAGPG